MKTLTRRLVAALAMAAAMFVIVPTSIAVAQGNDTITTASGGSLTFTAPVLSIVTGLVMPFVLALVTKLAASPFRKGVIGIVAAALAAVIERARMADGSAVFTASLVLDVGLIYGPQLLTYLGLWSKLGNGAGLNSKLLPGFGIG